MTKPVEVSKAKETAKEPVEASKANEAVKVESKDNTVATDATKPLAATGGRFNDRDRRGREGAQRDGFQKRRRPNEFDEEVKVWNPTTLLGKKVKTGIISSIHEIMIQPNPIKEVEIVNNLLPEMGEEVLDVGRVQRVTDSGRRMRFRVVAAVGNNDGYVGVAESKGKEAGPTIRKSIERAKLYIIEIKRGCGSWECGCGQAHTVPFEVKGKAGSVNVTLKPAPRGVGIVSGKLARTVLTLAGITDVWVKTEGHSRTGLNFAHAVINALKATNDMKLKAGDDKTLHIVTGACKPVQKPAPVPEVSE